MSDVDELLDGLEDEDDEETSPTPAVQDSSTITQLRRKLRDETKARKAAEARAEAAEPYKDKFLTAQLPKVLEEAGVENPTLLAKFAARDLDGEDLTVEWATNWATANGAVINKQDPEPAAQPTQGAPGATFAPTVGGDVPGVAKIPRAEIMRRVQAGEMSSAEASQLVQQGRVEWSNPEAVQASLRS